jgi:hypothetical protein
MKKKYAAGFVASLIALGVAISTIDTLQETAADPPNVLSVVGVVAAADVDNARNRIGSLFCLTEETDGDYAECVKTQSKMFSRGLSPTGEEPVTHYASGWWWSKNQFAAFEAIRDTDDLRISYSTESHPCMADDTCGDIEIYNESFDDMLKKLRVKTMNGNGIAGPGDLGRGPPEEIPFGGRGPPEDMPPEDMGFADPYLERGPPDIFGGEGPPGRGGAGPAGEDGSMPGFPDDTP